MNKKNENGEEKTNTPKKLSEFLKKYKTNEKFKAKTQLIGYGILIFIIIIYINIENATAPSYEKITSFKNDSQNQEQSSITDNKKNKLLEKINDNYEYDIKVKKITKSQENDIIKEVHYTGKSYKNNIEILKESEGITNNYYKEDTRYYTKNNDNYELTKENIVYDVVEKEYIELNDIKYDINKSSLDHVTEYSNGKKEYVYNLKIKDIIKSYLETDEIEIDITEENDTLTIMIDYTKLMQIMEEEVKECKIEYSYKNIGSVEEFKITNENE